MANKEQLNKVADMVAKAPLAEILDNIEAVIIFIPRVGKVGFIVTKILRMLLKLQPSVSNTMHGIANMQDNKSNVSKYASFIPTAENDDCNSIRTMVDIALEDGELTDEELSFLVNKAEAAGIDKDVFLMGVKNELNKVKNK